MLKKKIAFIEFNELCPRLLDRWMAEGILPNFKKFFESSAAFVTESDELEAPYLEPWIQWYSMHTGLEYQQHKVFRLTDGVRAEHDDIWRVLQRAGYRVGSLSSMNVRGFGGEGSFYVSDPWCTASAAHPAELQRFQDFVSAQVQGYTNPDLRLTKKDYLDFVAFMAGHGLRPKTASAITAQLAAEKLDGGNSSWKRASILDMMAFDVFRHSVRRHKPDFASLFTNSTAHYQHSYWRYMDPEPFTIAPSEDDLARYGGAVRHGYTKMDALMGDIMNLEKDGYMLMFSTALSQQPFLRLEEAGGQLFYRPYDIDRLLGQLGVDYTDIQPVMTHQYNIMFADAAQADDAETKLAGLCYDGEQAFLVQRDNATTIHFGCLVRTSVPDDAVISRRDSNEVMVFFEAMYQIDGMKSGCHHPDGVLWIKTGRHVRHPGKVSILDVFPTLLEIYGVEDAALEGRKGKSLVPILTGQAGQRVAAA